MSEEGIMPPPPAPQAAANGLKGINPWASYTVPDSLKSLDDLIRAKRGSKVKFVLLKKSQSLSVAGERSFAAPKPRAARARASAPNNAPAPKNKEVKLIIRNEEKGTTEKINIKKSPDDGNADSAGGWGDVMQHLKTEQSGAAVKIDIEDPEFGGIGADDGFGFPGTDAAAEHPIDDEWYGDADGLDEDFPGDFPAPEVKIETEDVKDDEAELLNEQSDSYNDDSDYDDDDSDFGERPSKRRKKQRGRPKKSQASGKCNNTKWSRASTWTRGKWKLKTRKGEEENMAETKPDATMKAITLDAYVVRDVVEDPRKRNKAEVSKESSAQEAGSCQTEDSSRVDNEGDIDVDVSSEGVAEGAKTTSERALADASEPDKSKEKDNEGSGEGKGEDLEEGLQKAYRDRRLFACPFCPFVSCKKIWLAHIKRLHDVPERRQLFWCKITPKKCGLPFTDEASREQHVREVHVAAHRCSVCEKEFKFPYMLRDHMSTAHGTKLEKVRSHLIPDSHY